MLRPTIQLLPNEKAANMHPFMGSCYLNDAMWLCCTCVSAVSSNCTFVCIGFACLIDLGRQSAVRLLTVGRHAHTSTSSYRQTGHSSPAQPACSRCPSPSHPLGATTAICYVLIETIRHEAKSFTAHVNAKLRNRGET